MKSNKDYQRKLQETYLEVLGNSVDDVVEFLNYKSESSSRVSQQIRDTADLVSRYIPALYGVWISHTERPVYIGQTLDARRRLWDLPIGESHHLASTFPLETWKKVVVLKWKDLLESEHDSFSLAKAFEVPNGFPEPAQLGRIGKEVFEKGNKELMGLALEYAFILKFKPIFNLLKKDSRGKLRSIDPLHSNSVGAMLQPFINQLFLFLNDYWKNLVEQKDTYSYIGKSGTVTAAVIQIS